MRTTATIHSRYLVANGTRREQDVSDSVPLRSKKLAREGKHLIQPEYETKDYAESNIRDTFPTKTCGDRVDALTKLLSDSIEETLTDLIGTRAREAVYDYMERNHSIARDELPENTDALFRLFENYFGTASKKVIGRMIAKKAYSKLNWEFQPTPKLEFNDYLEKIKTRLAIESLDQRPGTQVSS